MTGSGKVLLTTGDVLFWAGVHAAAKAAGVEAIRIGDEASMEKAFAEGGVRLVIADLAAPGIDVLAWAPRWKGADPAPRLIAYGSHVDVERMARAREAGFDEVMPNSRFHREYRDLLSPAPPR